jgi:formylglycine-generating enzyme required for sulfatase activity
MVLALAISACGGGTAQGTSVPTPSDNAPPKGSSTGETWTSPADNAVLVYVPEGSFDMGSNKEDDSAAYVDEMPRHAVWLDAFWIDRTEVTRGQFDRCVRSGACDYPLEKWGALYDPGKAEYPVNEVTWDQAKAYCEWAGRRLPTEAEWEKAARGTDRRRYPWGNETPDGSRLNFCDVNCAATPEWKIEDANDGFGGVAPVGSYAAGASPYGALDMLGNVEEWVLDWYAADYYQVSPQRNPPGPEEPGGYPYIANRGRVVRGNSYLGSTVSYTPVAPDGSVSPYGPVSLLRVTARWLQGAEFPSPTIGFRCAVSP